MRFVLLIEITSESLRILERRGKNGPIVVDRFAHTFFVAP
jgi:hypothetical protein